MPVLRTLAAAALLTLSPLQAASRAQTPAAASDVIVFAAASLKTAIDELAAPIQKATGVAIKPSYAATSALARQIEQGAPADLFISADLEWMDYVDTRGLIRKDTRVNLLTNRLVLIAPKANPITLKIVPKFALAAALGTNRRLAIADPAVVPAGKYAQAALTSLGVWPSVAAKLAPAENVRAALLFVSRGEAPLGIVYKSDAVADPGVVVVDTFPESSHPPIVYPAALTKQAKLAADKVLAFLQTPPARAVFDKNGFTR
ncbi:MAG TPA: molybdate ABC transporter substrate-binding protein [Vicinamibacterales bacterium]|nr:molybdate ABC transporter substrate-binding protein [Vicinamibacterales bacterium]